MRRDYDEITDVEHHDLGDGRILVKERHRHSHLRLPGPGRFGVRADPLARSAGCLFGGAAAVVVCIMLYGSISKDGGKEHTGQQKDIAHIMLNRGTSEDGGKGQKDIEAALGGPATAEGGGGPTSLDEARRIFHSMPLTQNPDGSITTVIDGGTHTVRRGEYGYNKLNAEAERRQNAPGDQSATKVQRTEAPKDYP